jgi:hypothetical protein
VTSVKRRLKEVGLNGRVLRKKPLLSAKNKKARYQWAKDHLDLTVEEWKKVNFSDETPFTLFQWCGTLSVFFRVFNVTNINIDMLEEYPDVYIVTSW